MLRCGPGRRLSEGYGPFSAIAKAKQRKQEAAPNMMRHVQLEMNLNLRLALAALPHPDQLKSMPYRGVEWCQAMGKLYRTILRLHNKTVAVSVDKTHKSGAVSAVAAVTGVSRAASSESQVDRYEDPTEVSDYLLRYLLTPPQREFGNQFVHSEFHRHSDADAVSARTFYQSWYEYVMQLASGVTSREMTEHEKRLLTDEQQEKLQQLHSALRTTRVESEPTYMV